MRVLIVEDEKRLAKSLEVIMTENNYTADVAFDGESGLDNALSGIYDVIILDVMLPYRNGYEIVKQLRHEGNQTPVLMLTAKSELADKVTGLDHGADYYLTKPFETEELLACIRAISRRQGKVIMEELAFGDIVLHLPTYTLYCRHRSVRLGLKEFQVMRLLLMNQNMILPKETLLLKIWGTESDAEDNNVEAYISFLRKKLFYLKSEVTISTVRMVGYHLEVSS
ncbi:MAG: response regulator transcription factor [Christensenellales bacterium]